MSAAALEALEFELPAELAAREPAELRGDGRDDVRLMVSYGAGNVITHTHFRRLPDFLRAGDVLVVNNSATISGAFPAHIKHSNEPITVHLSTTLSERTWVIELRRRTGSGTVPLLDARSGDRVLLPAGLEAVLVAAFIGRNHGALKAVRLWTVVLSRSTDAIGYAAAYGAPIRYDYVTRAWPLSYYHTVFSSVPGSAEMPSAGRPFTNEMINRLQANGVVIAPLVLHAGVASLEADEAPYPERYSVPAASAAAINRAREAGRRIVAVGTTVVRALETVSDDSGVVRAGNGWTDLIVTPERGTRAVDMLLTGFHAPRASHLLMLQALAGSEQIAASYRAALQRQYLWHEFGDLHLIVRG